MSKVDFILFFRDRIFSMKFMRMYIHIAKTLKPVLSDEASVAIAEEYSRLRSQDNVESGVARVRCLLQLAYIKKYIYMKQKSIIESRWPK